MLSVSRNSIARGSLGGARALPPKGPPKGDVDGSRRRLVARPWKRRLTHMWRSPTGTSRAVGHRRLRVRPRRWMPFALHGPRPSSSGPDAASGQHNLAPRTPADPTSWGRPRVSPRGSILTPYARPDGGWTWRMARRDGGWT